MESKRKAVAYCRVSTNSEEQKTSIKNQRTELRKVCEQNKWYVPEINVSGICDKGVYYDIGTSGTKLKRPAFDRLLLDAGLCPVVDADTAEKTTSYKIEKAPKFNVILVKDASRFSRNVSVNSIMQTLKDNGVYVYFADLNMTTEVNEHWSMIQQYFIFAENESRRKSGAVSFGYQAGVKQGKIYFGGKMIGYDYIPEENKLVVNEEEAKLVRLVFDLYTECELGQQRICNYLAEQGYFNSVGTAYGRSTIKRMLQNEKYCGITNTGRYHKEDLFSKKRVERDYNDPLRIEARTAQKKLEEQGIIKIEPIISVEQFQKAQAITARNSEIYKLDKSWHGTTDYAKKIVCGCCGAYYRANARRFNVEYQRKVSRFTCKHSIVYDEAHNVPKCYNPSINEGALDNALFSREYWLFKQKHIIHLIEAGASYKDVLLNAINTDNALAVQNIETEIEKQKESRKRVMKLYAKGTYSEAELDEINAEITENINKLEVKKEQLSKDNEKLYEDIQQIQELVSGAKEELKTVNKVLKTRKYPKKSRKELLRDVEKIVIDTEGTPHIIFRSLEDIKTTIQNMGIMINSYADAEEAGWEEEQKQADTWAKENGYLQEINPDNKSLQELIEQAETQGFVIKKPKNLDS